MEIGELLERLAVGRITGGVGDCAVRVGQLADGAEAVGEEVLPVARGGLLAEAGRSAAYCEWSDGLTARNISVRVAEAGLSFDLGEGAIGNRPDEQTLALFAGRAVLRTDERSAISFATDGRQLWIESER